MSAGGARIPVRPAARRPRVHPGFGAVAGAPARPQFAMLGIMGTAPVGR